MISRLARNAVYTVGKIVDLAATDPRGSGKKLVKIELLYEGDWKHKNAPGGVLHVDQKMLDTVELGFRDPMANTGELPSNLNHDDPNFKFSKGWLQHMEQGNRADGKRALYGYAEPIADIAEAIDNKEIKYCSPELRFNYKNPRNSKTYPVYMKGFAWTNTPYLTEQSPAQIVNLSDYDQEIKNQGFTNDQDKPDGGGYDKASPPLSEAADPEARDDNLPDQCRSCSLLFSGECPFQGQSPSGSSLKEEAAGEGTCPRYESLETTDPGNSPTQMTPLSEGEHMDPKIQEAIDKAIAAAKQGFDAEIVKLSEASEALKTEGEKRVKDLEVKLSEADEKVAKLVRKGIRVEREAWLSDYDLSPAQKDIFRDMIALSIGETVMLSETGEDGKKVEREATIEERLKDLAETMVDEGAGMNLSEAHVRRPRRSGSGNPLERTEADDDAFLAEVDEEVKTQIKARGGAKEDHYQTAWATVAANRGANRRELRDRAAGGR